MTHHQINAGKEHTETAPSHAHHASKKRRRAFTLIELLIVIGIVAIIMAIIVLVLNPAELLKRSRDSNRFSDAQTFQRSFNLYHADILTPILGSSSVLYVSIPDPTATTTAGTNCGTLGLPRIPTGWTYHCAASSTYKNPNGTGWIPVDFTKISSGVPVATLPTDPQNAITKDYYYTYATNGSMWEIGINLESNSYQNKPATDGGQDPAMQEIGSSLTISPFAHRMVGYWKFDEPSVVATSSDSSGFSCAMAEQTGGSSANLQTSAGCKEKNCMNLPGVNSYALISGCSNTTSTKNVTLMAWINVSSTADSGPFIKNGFPDLDGYGMGIGSGNINTNGFELIGYYDGASPRWMPTGRTITSNAWHHVAMVIDDSSVPTLYLDGQSAGSFPGTPPTTPSIGTFYVGGKPAGFPQVYITGRVDEVRVYDKALSAAQIQAIYDATK